MEVANNDATTWLNWCRLCAKREDQGRANSCIFTNNEAGKAESELTTSIGKYFWVNIKAEDEISKRLCVECRKLIGELINFTERINKVQTMYVLLQNLKPATATHANKLRTQCGLIDEGWEHIIKPEKPKEVEKPKPQLIDQEAQTDLMIYFNTNSDKPKETFKRKSLEQEPPKLPNDIMKNLNEHLGLNVDDNETVHTVEVETEKTYKYVVNDTGEVDYVENREEEQRDCEPKVVNMAQEEEDVDTAREEEEEEEDDEVEVHDSDLFKELKFKVEEEDESQLPVAKKFKFSTDQEEIELEYQETLENHNLEEMQGDESHETLEVYHDDEFDEENLKTSDTIKIEDKKTIDFQIIANRKPGRPTSTNNKADRSAQSTPRYECKDCKRKYKNPNVYRKHMLTVHEVVVENLTDFTCPECHKDCLTESRLKNHVKCHLSDEEKLVIPCPYCDKKFAQVGTMKQHVNGIHHQKKPFICDQCGRACKTMAALNEHQLVHTDNCPFECEVCHKRFKNKPRLKSHMDTHTKSVYACPECGLELNTRRTLLQHRLVHSDVKRFKCEFCESTFKRSKALKNHLILHSGLRPYVCNFCGKSFSNGSNCRAHKKRSHPTELAEEEASGIKRTTTVVVPKLEELKLAKSALIQPRKIKRHSGGLPENLRKILLRAEQRKHENLTDEPDEDDEEEDDTGMENYDYSDMHYEIDDTEIEEGFEDHAEMGEDCEETVIYEIIDEI